MTEDSKSYGIYAEQKSLALSLADIFSDSVECFGMIHASKKVWDRPQQVILTKLGIQQARLLAWGDFVGILDLSDGRNISLDDPESRAKIEITLRDITHMCKTEDKTKQLESYGLKPTKLGIEDLEHAVDLLRRDSFRERYALLSPTRRSPTITGLHWLVTDIKKIMLFIVEIRTLVDSLITQFDLESRVSSAVKSDIRALAWHPVFDRPKAAADGAKLQLIKEACSEWYPEYCEATRVALAYLNKEWNDSYEESMANSAYRFRPPSAAPDILGKKAQADAKKAKDARIRAKVAEAAAANQQYSLDQVKAKYTHPHGKDHHAEEKSHTDGQQKPMRLSIFSHFRPRSWRRHSTKSEETPRAMSSSAIDNQNASEARDDMESLMPVRSRSMVAMPTRPLLDSVNGKQPDIVAAENGSGKENESTIVTETVDDSAQSTGPNSLQPIVSMASRHDYLRNSIG